MNHAEISLTDARKIALQSQLLNGCNLSTLKVIEHIGYVQIDTISVVERAHHHVLWTRNPQYKPGDINNLVKKRKVFEHWSHAASYLPIKDYRFTLIQKKRFKEKSWYSKDHKLMSEVLKRITNEGPLRSKDFKNFKKGNSGWWDWKPAKNALEQLFLNGELEISERENFQKVFDLTKRVIPSSIDQSEPTEDEFARYLINRTLRSYGYATLSEISYLQKGDIKKAIHKTLMDMIEDKRIIKLKIKNIPNEYYTLKKSLKISDFDNSRIHIFSPFDNFLIQRKRLSEIYKMNYNLECYVPGPKRKFGYFSLPIFKGVNPVGRADCRVDRKSKTFNVLSLHSEKPVNRIDPKIKKKFREFASFNQCSNEIVYK